MQITIVVSCETNIIYVTLFYTFLKNYSTSASTILREAFFHHISSNRVSLMQNGFDSLTDFTLCSHEPRRANTNTGNIVANATVDATGTILLAAGTELAL